MTGRLRSRLIGSALLVLSATALLAGFAGPYPAAIAQERAYAPDDLRTLSRQDQTRVIRKEYAEQSGGRSLPDDQLEFYLDQVNRSNWRFSDIKREIATSLAGSQQPASASVHCASERFRYRECQTRFASTARLAQNLSKTRCVEGENWGSRTGMVWVDKGCQGRFVAARPPSQGPAAGTGNYTVTCSSSGEITRTCAWDIRRGSPVLVQQLSQAPCVAGRSWRYEEGRIWVSDGCGARFGVAAGPGGQAPEYSVTCTSNRLDSTVWCPWEQRRGTPRLREEFTYRRCTEGRTWGYVPARGIWVADACSARFTGR